MGARALNRGRVLFQGSLRPVTRGKPRPVAAKDLHRIVALSLNHETVAAVRGCAVEGVVRFGLPGDLADGWLPRVLGQFKRAHPGVRIEAAVDRNSRLLERLDEEAFDLVLALGAQDRPDAR